MEPPPLPFQLQDPERLRTEFAAAGLNTFKVETITETTEFWYRRVPVGLVDMEQSNRCDGA